MVTYNQYKFFPFFLYLVSFLSLIFPWLALAFFIACVSQLINRTFTKLNFIGCMFVSVMSVGAFIGFLGFAIDLYSPYVNQFRVIQIIVVLLSTMYIVLSRAKLYKYRNTSTYTSIVSLVITCLAIAFLSLPASQSENGSEMVYFLSSSEDNASHFAIFERNILKKSTSYFDSKPTGLIQGLNMYPQAIHSFASFSYWSIFGDKAYSTFALLKMYYAVMVFACACLVFVVSETIGNLVRNKHKTLAMIIGSTVIFTGAILYLVGWGFVTQIMALAYLFTILFVVIIEGERTNKHTSSLVMELIIYGLLSIGIAMTWYIFLPVAFLALVKRFWHLIKIRSMPVLVTMFIVLSAVVMPIVFSVIRGKTSGSINSPGGVYAYTEYMYLVFAAGLLIFVITHITKGRKFTNEYFPIILFVYSSYTISLLIGVYQLITVGSLRYYFHKSIYLVFIVTVFILVITVFSLLSRIKSTKQIIFAQVVIAVAFVTSYILVNPVYPRVYINNWFNHPVKPDSISEAISIRDKKNSNTTDVLYSEQCNYIEEYILNRWTGAIYLSDNADRSELAHDTLRQEATLDTMNDYANLYPQTTIIQVPCDITK